MGKNIVEKQGGETRADYGTQLIQALSEQITADFGKGFDVRNLNYMQQFYLAFQNVNALRSKLSWTHSKLLMHVESEQSRQFYIES